MLYVNQEVYTECIKKEALDHKFFKNVLRTVSVLLFSFAVLHIYAFADFILRSPQASPAGTWHSTDEDPLPWWPWWVRLALGTCESYFPYWVRPCSGSLFRVISFLLPVSWPLTTPDPQCAWSYKLTHGAVLVFYLTFALRPCKCSFTVFLPQGTGAM